MDATKVAFVFTFQNPKDCLVVAGSKHWLDNRPDRFRRIQARPVVPARLTNERAIRVVGCLGAPIPGASGMVEFEAAPRRVAFCE